MGSARTALFNWLFARGSGGEMLLRIEDTDLSLKKQAFVDAIVDPLRWLGIDWDSGPYYQSEHRDRHLDAVDRLVACGAAYYCDLSHGEITAKARAAGLPAGYYGWSRDRGVSDGPGVVVRFRSSDHGVTEVNDLVRGQVTFANDTIEDFVIRRGDGSPTFLIANAVDDHEMGISHVIRGEDLLNTTPRVLMLWEALGYGRPPTYAHLPLLVDAKRRKLAKRRHDVSLDDYRARGYLSEAVVNYLALLGWGPPDGTEIRPLDEIIELFDLAAVKPGSAFFDQAKLDHFNTAYLRVLDSDQLAERAEPFLSGGVAAEVVRALAEDIKPRVTTLSDIQKWIAWVLTETVDYDPKSWRKAIVKGRAAKQVLVEVTSRLAQDDFSSAERLESIVMGVGNELTQRLGIRVLSQAPVRVAVTGTNVGLPLWQPLQILGKERTLERLRSAVAQLDSGRPDERPQTR